MAAILGTAGTAPSSIAVPSYVPAAYRGLVAQAAAATGLPASVVAAQINESYM